MGCGFSKKVARENSLQKKLNRPFPRATEDLLLTNNHNQFVALVCKANNVAKKFVLSEPEDILPFIGKDNEAETITGVRHMSVETHVRVNLDLQSGKLLKEKIWEEHKDAERESEENKATEEDKTEIINTWELMEGLDDGEACNASKKIETDRDTLSFNRGDICEEVLDQSPPTRVSRRSKSMESFHTVEEYDAFLARSKSSLWDRNSKSHLYFLGHEHLNKFRSTSLSRLSSCTRFSIQGGNMVPIVVDSKEDSKSVDNSKLEFPVRQPSFELRDSPQTVSENNSREEKNGIAQTVSENNGSQENDHSVEVNTGNINLVKTNSEKAQSLEINSRKNIMQVRANLNNLGGIIIPTAHDFSAVGSLNQWLQDEGHLYSPGESTSPRFGYSGIGDTWPTLNFNSSSGQLSSDEESETYSFPVSSIDGKFATESGDSAIENKQWDHPPFDPELLASLEKDLEQLFQEEQHLLRQIDGDSNLLCGKFYAKGTENGLQDSSGTEDTRIQSICRY